MTDNANDKPIEVDERVDTYTLKLEQKLAADELINIIQEAKRKHLKLKWTGLKVGLERRSKEEIDIVFMGVRLEAPDETQHRLSTEATRRKFVEDQELKEYLRLKRKFENKNEQQS